MSNDYSIRTKKVSVVGIECLQTVEADIINNIINSWKEEIIKDFVTNAPGL